MAGAVELRRYQTASGRDVFGDWLSDLKDTRAKAKILARVDRLSLGNFGDCKSPGAGLFELRIDRGPGYRLYYATIGRTCVLLLCDGDKSRQSEDIRRETEYLKDYRERTR
jgi:putative addiction module killer protein